jgi:hypothetical protein
LFVQGVVSRIIQIETAACEHDGLAVAFPFAAAENQLILRNHAAQTFELLEKFKISREHTILTRAPEMAGFAR